MPISTDDIDVADLSDKDIAIETRTLSAEIRDIGRQLDDDKDNGFRAPDVWRGRAYTKRRYMAARMDELRDEAALRRVAV